MFARREDCVVNILSSENYLSLDKKIVFFVLLCSPLLCSLLTFLNIFSFIFIPTVPCLAFPSHFISELNLAYPSHSISKPFLAFPSHHLFNCFCQSTFHQVVKQVEDFNSARIRLAADMADDSQRVKALIVRAEDSRLMMDMESTRRAYTELYALNNQLIGDASNH